MPTSATAAAPSPVWKLWPGARLCQRMSATAAFLIPALALCLPSGYSWGALLLLCMSLLALRHWGAAFKALTPSACALAVAIVGMALVWALGLEASQGLRRFDRVAKYLLVLPCLLYLSLWPPRSAALRWGLVVGAFGSGSVALYQVLVLGWERASGFTNAIQYGNLSLLLALMCALWWAAGAAQLTRLQQAGLLWGGLWGVLGSVLSQSRGGWLALVLSAPLWALWWLRWQRRCPERRLRAAGRLRSVALGCVLLLALGLIGAIGALKGGAVAQRLALVYEESAAYWSSGQAQTSVGQRLEHWRLAWRLGLERPITGWGEAGYVQEKRRRVELGQANAVLLGFDHAHNEFLDMFAKRGLVGVGGLLLFYAVPIALFWPSRRRRPELDTQEVQEVQEVQDTQALALRVVGLALPISYAGFGLTQVFLAHNSGNMFYLFLLVLCASARNQK